MVCFISLNANICEMYFAHQRWLGMLHFISYLSYYLQCCALPEQRCLSQGLCLYQVMMMLHFLNGVANGAESTQETKIASWSLVWRAKQCINWYIEYQVRVFWYQIYQARLWECMLNHSASLVMSTSILKVLPSELDIKRHHLVFSIYNQLCCVYGTCRTSISLNSFDLLEHLDMLLTSTLAINC